ncbi:MAG: alkaline phosphatase family protein [Solirubrobacterales bacterium]
MAPGHRSARHVAGARRTGRTARSAIIILADGARADSFERMLDAGELPEIARHVVERGAYRRATSTFTSTTVPAHLPMLTGQFAGTADVPGYRWFDRRAWRPGLPLGPWCLRSYNGPEAALVNRDIAAAAPTLFELTDNAVNVFGAITRGVTRDGNLAAARKTRLWLDAHYRRDYVSADEAARELLVASLDDDAELRFAVMPGIDWNSHYSSPFACETEEAYRRVDRTVGAVARKLIRLGRYDQTLIAVCSDHGHCPVDEHFDLPVRLERDHGLRVAYHSLRALRRDAEAIVCVSGNSMAHVYVRGSDDWGAGPATRGQISAAAPGMVERLITEPAVDLVVSRDGGDGLLIESSRGSAVLRERAGSPTRTTPGAGAGAGPGADAGELVYTVSDAGDPFGYGPLPGRMRPEEALALTFDSGHPDGLLQVAQIFRSPRCGDLVVSAAPGYDLRDRFERPEHLSGHGALHSQHMRVPLAVSAPLADGPIRTADIFSSVLAWLGSDATSGTDGVSRLVQSTGTPAMSPVSGPAGRADFRDNTTPPHSE